MAMSLDDEEEAAPETPAARGKGAQAAVSFAGQKLRGPRLRNFTLEEQTELQAWQAK